jgi:hypothetical protein
MKIPEFKSIIDRLGWLSSQVNCPGIIMVLEYPKEYLFKESNELKPLIFSSHNGMNNVWFKLIKKKYNAWLIKIGSDHFVLKYKS